jgi:hypothetical protein
VSLTDLLKLQQIMKPGALGTTKARMVAVLSRFGDPYRLAVISSSVIGQATVLMAPETLG